MKSIPKLTTAIAIIALTTLIGHTPALAGTFVYVSNADEGDIGVYSVQTDGSLKPGERAKTANIVMPMAVSPDKRFLYAATRSKPYSVFVYAIDPNTGALKTLSVSALAESFPYISLDKTGRYLFGASYSSHLISVNAVETDGRVAPVYVLSELTGSVTTFSLDSGTGLLTEVSSASGLPPESKLVPGAPRGPVGVSGGPPPRNTGNDIWAADLHLTPNGKFLYMTERTSNSFVTFSVDGANGKLTYLGSTPAEKQPRGFAIDPKGRFLVVSGEKSDTISAYAIDEASGALTLIGKYPAGKGANWVEIVSFD